MAGSSTIREESILPDGRKRGDLLPGRDMFEIGTTLRDARVRQNISLQQAEDDTKIRIKYIQALENEDFKQLPGDTYAKGFLRTYAGYLGLDFQILLDEFNERFGDGEYREHVIQPPRTAKPKEPHKRKNYVFVAILAVAIIAVLAYLGWGNSSSEKPALVTSTTASTGTDAQTQAAPAGIGTGQTGTETAPAETATTETQPGVFQSIVFKSSSSNNWVEVYKDSTMKQVIWGGTLAAGDSKSLGSADLQSADAVWLDLGSVKGLVITVNGQDQQISRGGLYKVTPSGLTPAGG